jgi:phage terminase small subunit
VALSPKQRQFVAEYLVDLNASAAAARAGYSGRTSRQIGDRLLTKVDVQVAIQAAMAERSKRTGVTQDMVVRELARVAFGDRRKLMTWGPEGVRLVDSSELDENDAAAVAEVSETTTKDGGSLKLKTHDKVAALKLLGEHLGMFKQRVELTGRDGGPVAQTNVTPEQLAEAVRGVQDKF